MKLRVGWCFRWVCPHHLLVLSSHRLWLSLSVTGCPEPPKSWRPESSPSSPKGSRGMPGRTVAQGPIEFFICFISFVSWDVIFWCHVLFVIFVFTMIISENGVFSCVLSENFCWWPLFQLTEIRLSISEHWENHFSACALGWEAPPDPVSLWAPVLCDSSTKVIWVLFGLLIVYGIVIV